jgi:hypothetical protein
MLGFAAEEQFKSFLRLQRATFPVAEYPSAELILELASCYHSKKLRTILNTEGTLSALRDMGSPHLMDLIFLCDALVKYDDINGESINLSIDVTSNFKAVFKKEEEISSKQETLSKLGVNRALVVVWQITRFASITRAQTYNLAAKIIEQLDSNNHFVNTVVLTNSDLD